MTLTTYLASDLTNLSDFTQANAEPASDIIKQTGRSEKETLRHILLGSPGVIQRTIHLLHSLHYAEPLLWSPIMDVKDRLIITPEQGDSISLLRRSLWPSDLIL